MFPFNYLAFLMPIRRYLSKEHEVDEAVKV